jgi:hypothetical protein
VPLDLNQIKAALQAKIDALTANSPMLEILQLERAALPFGTTRYYDSDGDLPPPTDFPEGSIVSTYQPTLTGPSKLFINSGGSWSTLQTLANAFEGQAKNWGQDTFYSLSNNSEVKIPFASAGASSVATLTGFRPTGPTDQSIIKATSTSSATQGYVSGGAMVAYPGPGSPNSVSTIKSFTYSSETPAGHTGTLTTDRGKSFGFQSIGGGKSYHGGGEYYDDTTPVGPGAPDGYQPVSTIESFPHASPATNASIIGDMSFVPAPNGPTKYFTHGTAINAIGAAYIANFQVNYGSQVNINANEIYKFPFASSTPVTVSAYGVISGQGPNGLVRSNDANWATEDNGYMVGGFERGSSTPTIPVTTRIDKLPFSSDTTASASPGTLPVSRTNMACDNNDVKGYAVMGHQGGYGPAGGASSEYAFATDIGSYSSPNGLTVSDFSANNIGFSV